MAYKRKPYRYKFRYKLLFWSMIGMIVFSIASVLMNRPTTGTIIKPSLQDSPAQEQPVGTNTMTAKHFRLVYDDGLDTVSNISGDDRAALEVYRVARSDETGRRTFVITIKNLPSGGMGEESSYKLRLTQPATYRQSAQTVGGIAYVVFEKTDGTEVTAFTSDSGRLAMLAYTLNAPSGNLHEEVTSLLGQFSWLN